MKILAPTLLLAGFATAQDAIPCNTIHVDPVNGSDTNPGQWLSPLRTLTAAVALATNSAGHDTILLRPGFYEHTVESYPLTMPAGVSIQGTSALNTILRSRDPLHSSVLRFVPTTATAYDDVVVDAVTIIGVNRGIEIVDGVVDGFRVRANPTVANCFLSTSEEATGGAIDMRVTPGGTPFPGHDLSGNGLVEHRPKVVNCTIVNSRLGIFNRVAQTPSSGESQPGLLNCLLSNNVLADLEGIDAGDVITCAFATANTAGLSAPIGVQPVPVFDTTVFPPVYVETNLNIVLSPHDLRVQPGSPAIDSGSLPSLVWPNLTTGSRFFACTVDVFDADCEGYGNPRVARNGIDIGADESGELIIGGYQRGTTELNLNGNSPYGGLMPIWVNPFPPLPPGSFSAGFATTALPTVPPIGFWLLWEPPGIQGLRGLLTVAPTFFPGIGTQWMDLTSAATFTPPAFTSPATPLMLPIVLTAPVQQMEWQALPFQGSTTSLMTNLQTLFVTP